jgi:hypothetical protein
MPNTHLHDELKDVNQSVTVETRFGPVTGGKARNGTSVFLGMYGDTSIITSLS